MRNTNHTECCSSITCADMWLMCSLSSKWQCMPCKCPFSLYTWKEISWSMSVFTRSSRSSAYVKVHACLHTVFQTACRHNATGENDKSAVHSPVEEVSKIGSMRFTHCTALSRNIWSADSSKAPMSPPTTRMLVSNKLMRRLELHSSFVLTHSRALHCADPELTASLLEDR